MPKKAKKRSPRKTDKFKRTTMRLDRTLKARLKARAQQEGRHSMRLFSAILRDGLADAAPLQFDATGYAPRREITTVRLDGGLLRELNKRAKTEERSASNVAEIMLHNALILGKQPDASVFG